MKFDRSTLKQAALRAARYATKATISLVVFFVLSASFAIGLSHWSAHHYAPGDAPRTSSHFMIAIVPGSGGQPFDIVHLEDVGKHPGTLLLPKKEDRFTDPQYDYVWNAYTVLEDHGREQLIEFRYHNSDYDSWSVYRATADGVVPVSFRLRGPGHGFSAVPFAVAGTYLFWFIVRRIRRKPA